MRTFASSYCILFCRIWLLSLGGLLFPEGRQRESGLVKGEMDWGGWGGAMEGGESVVWMYCMREDYFQ